MFRNFTLIISLFSLTLIGACADSLPGTLPTTGIDATVRSVDNAAPDTAQSEPDLGTPTAGLDIENPEPDIWTEEDTSVNEDASFEDTSVVEDIDFDDTTSEDLMIEDSSIEEDVPDTTVTCLAIPEMVDACWNGIDDDCDGLTDQIGGDSDCLGYCQPASTDCSDNDPTTEDFCSPLDRKCKNLGCATDCNDHNVCTADSCVNGQCQSLPIAECFPCLSNTDCYAKHLTCQAGTCQPTTFSMILGDGNVCETQSDCAQSPWGKNCVPSAYPNMPSLCQECIQKDSDGDEIDDGCIAEHPYCGWGLTWDNPATGYPRSVYQCE